MTVCAETLTVICASGFAFGKPRPEVLCAFWGRHGVATLFLCDEDKETGSRGVRGVFLSAWPLLEGGCARSWGLVQRAVCWASPRAGAAFELGGFEEMLQSYPEVLEGRKKSRSWRSRASVFPISPQHLGGRPERCGVFPFYLGLVLTGGVHGVVVVSPVGCFLEETTLKQGFLLETSTGKDMFCLQVLQERRRPTQFPLRFKQTPRNRCNQKPVPPPPPTKQKPKTVKTTSQTSKSHGKKEHNSIRSIRRSFRGFQLAPPKPLAFP